MYKSNNDISFEKCYPIENHAKQIMEWRNDPITLSMFYHQDPKVWSNFWNEFRNTYFLHSQEIHPVFAIFENKKVGFLKFAPVQHPMRLEGLTIDISINISPACRGKGLGTKVLTSCIEYLFFKGVDSIYAEILSHNTASIKAFKGSGFKFIEQREKIIADTGEVYSIQCFLVDMIANY